MFCANILAEWLKMGMAVIVVGLLATACSSPSVSAPSVSAPSTSNGSDLAGEQRSREGEGSTAEAGVSLWDDFWSDFSAAAVVQDSLKTADLTTFPYASGWGEPINRATFVEQYDALFPDEVRQAFANPGENLSLEVDGAEVLIDSEFQRIPEGGGYPGLDVNVATARVFFVSEFSSIEGLETEFHYVFDLVDGEYRFISDYVF